MFVLILMFVTSGPRAASDYAEAFLELGVGARPLGMGSAYVAVAEGPEAVYWNPAGLVLGEGTTLGFMHSERFAGLVRNDFVGASFSRRGWGAGTSLVRTGVEGIKFTALRDTTDTLSSENRPYVLRRVGSGDYVLLLSSALSSGGLALGGSFKILYRRLWKHTAWGAGLDLGVVYTWRRFRVGACLHDVYGTPVLWDSGSKDTIAPSLDVGISYRRDLLRGSFCLSTSFRRKFRAGLEYTHSKGLALRLGWDGAGLTAGVGVSFARFRADYAFLANRSLGGTHRVSLQVNRIELRNSP